MKQMLLFQVGGRQYGLLLPHVRHIEAPEDGTERAGPGRLRIGGDTLRHLSLQSVFGAAGTSPAADSKVMVIKAPAGDLAVGVDRLDGVVNAGDDRVDPIPRSFGREAAALFSGVFKSESGPVLLLRPEGIETAGDRSPRDGATARIEVSADRSGEPPTGADPGRRQVLTVMGDAAAEGSSDLDSVLTRLVSDEEMARRVEAILARVSAETASEKVEVLKGAIRRKQRKGDA